MLAGSILQKLKAAHQPGQSNRRPLNFGVYYKNTLVELCHALEDAVLASTSTEPLIVAAFQRGKWYLQEADRYGEIADKARQIVIMAAPEAGFADHPTGQRKNVALVSLDPSDPVAQEWHLMILAPSYSGMVLCQELTAEDYEDLGIPSTDLERKFYGFWTFEPGLVQETIELAIAHMGVYDPGLQAKLTTQINEVAAAIPTTPRDELGAIVSRIVTYLQTNQQQLQPTSLDDNLTSNELQALLRMAQIIDQTDLSNPRAAAEVAALAEAMGQLLDLPAWQLHRLRLAGLLHRLAFQSAELSLSDPELVAPTASAGPTCPLNPRIQALRTMSRLRAIAAILAHQSEYWDGSGSPLGLTADAIPLESRILGLVADFQQHLASQRQNSEHSFVQPDSDESLANALAICQEQAGICWDPKLVDALTLLVSGLQQGLNLSIQIPKIAAGLWLIDSYTQEHLFVDTQPDNLTVKDATGADHGRA
jgi:DICT domain-containing protein